MNSRGKRLHSNVHGLAGNAHEACPVYAGVYLHIKAAHNITQVRVSYTPYLHGNLLDSGYQNWTQLLEWHYTTKPLHAFCSIYSFILQSHHAVFANSPLLPSGSRYQPSLSEFSTLLLFQGLWSNEAAADLSWQFSQEKLLGKLLDRQHIHKQRAALQPLHWQAVQHCFGG